MQRSYQDGPFRLSDDEEGPHFRSLPPPLLFMPPSSSHSLFLPALFCSSVLTPFPFLSLQAKCEQPSGRVRLDSIGLFTPPIFAVFSAEENVIAAGCRLFFAFNSRPYITHHPKSTPRAFFAALFLAILVPDSLDLHIKADEFLCPSFPSSHGFQISNLSLF